MELLFNTAENRFEKPNQVRSILEIALVLDRVLPVDPAHNVVNHGIPVALNITKFVSRFDPHSEVRLDNLVIAGLLHDRQRFVIGHLPFELITKSILNKVGLKEDNKIEIMTLIHNHSDLRNRATLGEKYLYLADKKEYFSIPRLEQSIGKFPKFAVDLYKKHWKKRVGAIMNNVDRLDRSEFDGIAAIFKEDIIKLNRHIKEFQPQMIDLFDGVKV